jgi:hypothetical protein
MSKKQWDEKKTMRWVKDDEINKKRWDEWETMKWIKKRRDDVEFQLNYNKVEEKKKSLNRFWSKNSTFLLYYLFTVLRNLYLF